MICPSCGKESANPTAPACPFCGLEFPQPAAGSPPPAAAPAEPAKKCPRCGASAAEGTAECPACGIIFSKWRPPLGGEAAAAPSADQGFVVQGWHIAAAALVAVFLGWRLYSSQRHAANARKSYSDLLPMEGSTFHPPDAPAPKEMACGDFERFWHEWDQAQKGDYFFFVYEVDNDRSRKLKACFQSVLFPDYTKVAVNADTCTRAQLSFMGDVYLRGDGGLPYFFQFTAGGPNEGRNGRSITKSGGWTESEMCGIVSHSW